jgi:hypothetical protein
MKRVVVVSDLHCGHAVGLTPPEWRYADSRAKLSHVREQCWDFFATKAAEHGPFDVVIANGDMIDGKGSKAEGVETIVPDRHEQCKMAVACIRHLMQPNTQIVMTYGTDYHTGSGEDFETIVASELQAVSVGNIAHVEIEGVVFEAKHHVGGSQVPHTRHTGIARDRLWNLLWAERGVSPKAQVIIRSHVHYFNYCGGPDWVAMTTPALQGFGSRFGARRMSGLVDFGFVVFTVDNGRFTWEPVLASVEAQRSTVIKL